MATIRQFLNGKGFDWDSGMVIVHVFYDEDSDHPRYHPVGFAFLDQIKDVIVVHGRNDHDVLEYEFYSGHGGVECPCFVAYDKDRIYFPAQYDGATWCESVRKDPKRYLSAAETTPYPGG